LAATMSGMATRQPRRGRAPSPDTAAKGPVSNAIIRVTQLHVIRAREISQAVGLHLGQELRATPVESTPAGTALRGRVEQLWAELEAATVAAMSAASQSALLHGLLQVERNLASHGPADQ
jgi:MarR family transcriptional regulator, organic hydroperoxide resistance regulator